MCVLCRTQREFSFAFMNKYSSIFFQEYKMIQGKEEKKSFHPQSDNILYFFVYFLSPMHFQIIHTFLPHYAQSSKISVLCMDKRGSKACQIHFKRLSSCSYHYMKLETAVFSAFPS